MKETKLNWRKYLKYLFFLGIGLMVAGLVSGLISNNWSLFPVIILVTGGIFVILGLVFSGIFSQSFWQQRSTQAGTNAFVATTSVIVILALINFLAVSYSQPIDLTENKLFTLAPQTQEIVKSLSEPIKVWIFEKELNPSDKDLLVNYQRQNPNFQFEVVDPNVKVGLAEKFKVQSLGEVYLEYNDKRLLVQTLNPGESLSEIQLTTKIEKILGNEILNIYFLQGHGEVSLEEVEGGFSQAVKGLTDKGFEVKPLNLAQTPAIPEDVDVIIIAGAKREFLSGEITTLEKYLDQGGKLLLMIDPNTKTGLEKILDKWGVQLDQRVVIDPSGIQLNLGPAISVVTNYANHPITKDFGNGISIYPLARPIGAIPVKNIEAVGLLNTSDQSWAEADLESNDEPVFNAEQDIKGPIDLAVVFTRSEPEKSEGSSENKPESSPESSENKPENSPESSENKPENSPESSENKSENSPESSENKSENSPESSENKPENSPESSENKPETSEESKPATNPKKIESKMIVFGNSIFASNGWFQQQLNGDVFLNSVTWLASGDDQPLSIRPREAKNRRINLQPIQSIIISLMAILIIPMIGLIVAGVTWWRRR